MLSLLRKLVLILVLIDCVTNADGEESVDADEILIGALIDDNKYGEETLTAFLYAISMENENHPSFRLKDADPNVSSMTNNFFVINRICQLMSNGSIAFFASHTMDTIDAIKSYSSNFRMPFVTSGIALNTSGQEVGYEFYVRPYYMKAIADVIKYRHWHDLWYLYYSDEGLERWRQLTDGFTQNVFTVKMRIRRVVNAAEAAVTLQRLLSSLNYGTTFLLDFPTKDCEELLKILDTDNRAGFHQYFVVGFGIEEMNYEAHQLYVIGLRLVDGSSRKVRSFLRNWLLLDPSVHKGAGRSQISYEAALAVDAVSVISHALQRMINEKSTIFNQTLRDVNVHSNGSQRIDCDADPLRTFQYGPDIKAAIKETESSGLTGNIKFDKFGLRRDYKLDILAVTRNRDIEKVGVWDSEKGVDIQIEPTPLKHRAKGEGSMANKTRIITSVVTVPYLFLNSSSLKANQKVHLSNEMFSGYSADLARMIAENIGFNYIISPVKDGRFGSKTDAGWNGMVGELVRHEADLAVAPLTITSERERVIDFSVPFMSTGIGIMMKKPTKEPGGAFAFLNPFSCNIWLCIFFGYFGVQVLLFVVSWLTQFRSVVEEGKAGNTNCNVFSCLRMSRRPVRSVTERVVSNTWSIATIILVSLYTAKLFSMLKAERMKVQIESADDLSMQTEIKYGLIEGGSTAEFFRRSTTPVYERMWAFMSASKPSLFVVSNEEGVGRVRNGKYALIGESNAFEYFNERLPCDTMTIGRSFNIKGYGIATPLGSDLRDRINIAVMELTESGKLQQLQNKWWYNRGECSISTRMGRVGGAVRLSNVAGLFYMLIGCLFLGLIILIFERLCKSHIDARIAKNENHPMEEQVEVLERL